MGGDDDSHIHGDRALTADALDFALFQHAQQFGLHGERHVADFIEKDGAVLGLLELAEMAAGRAGERSFFVSEQFGFNQLRRNRGTVQRDERTAGSRTALMQSARDQFLSGAGFTENADARFARRHALYLRHDAAHGLALPDDLMFAEAARQVAILTLEAAELECVFHGKQKFFGRDWLFQEVEGTEASRPHSHFNVCLARHHDDWSRHALRFEFFEKRQAVFAGHHNVGEYQVERLRLGQVQSLICVVADGGFMPFQTKCSRQRSQGVGLVVDDQ